MVSIRKPISSQGDLQNIAELQKILCVGKWFLRLAMVACAAICALFLRISKYCLFLNASAACSKVVLNTFDNDGVKCGKKSQKVLTEMISHVRFVYKQHLCCCNDGNCITNCKTLILWLIGHRLHNNQIQNKLVSIISFVYLINIENLYF